MKPKSLSTLKREKEQSHSRTFCWAAGSFPTGLVALHKATTFINQLRSVKPIDNGKRNRHLKTEEIAYYRRLIANGKKLW